MDGSKISRNWKYVHHARKQSGGDSLNASFESSHSNSSAKFNRFQFNRHDESVAVRREPIFAFSGKNREKQEYSVLSKRSNKESDTSKMSDYDFLPSLAHPANPAPLPQGPPTSRSATPAPTTPLKPKRHPQLHSLLDQVKTLTSAFRKLIDYFSRQIKEMQTQWEKSFRQILAQQTQQQADMLKNSVEMQQRKLEQIAKDSNSKGEQFSRVEFDTGLRSQLIEEIRESSLSRLAISKVEQGSEVKLSRNNTIASLLNHDHPSHNRELRSLRQTVKRMREILEDDHT